MCYCPVRLQVWPVGLLGASSTRRPRDQAAGGSEVGAAGGTAQPDLRGVRGAAPPGPILSVTGASVTVGMPAGLITVCCVEPTRCECRLQMPVARHIDSSESQVQHSVTRTA